MDDLHPMSGFPIPKNQRVPRNLWDRTPWNRWSFQHIREILPTTEVWRGTGLPWLLPEAEKNLDELNFVNQQNQSTTLLEWLTDNYADGIAVLHRGTLVYERYFNRMTERTLHLSQSMAKSVTSAVAGILVGRGQLDPTASDLNTDRLKQM
jgi:CubicO group peptidase (beta-lactamase class C family)